jgi:hypothetical protein
MDNRECDEMYERLTSMLNQVGMGWITAQVTDQVRLGKTIEREIETLKEGRERDLSLFADIDDYPTRFKKGPKATFPVTEEYRPSERLLLLIDALERAVVHTAEMESHLFEYFGEMTDLGEIQFYFEEMDVPPISLERRKVIARFKNSEVLKGLLDTLRKGVRP